MSDDKTPNTENNNNQVRGIITHDVLKFSFQLKKDNKKHSLHLNDPGYAFNISYEKNTIECSICSITVPVVHFCSSN